MSPPAYGAMFAVTLATFRLVLGVPRPDFVWLALLHISIYMALEAVGVFR